MKIKILNKMIEVPKYQTTGSSGVDLQASLRLPRVIYPHRRFLIPTGIALEMEDGTSAFVFSRSGTSSKTGLMLSNGVGVIDSDYRGEIFVSITNTSSDVQIINPLERIAQLVFMPVIKQAFEVVEELNSTERGEGGFGSTDKINFKASTKPVEKLKKKSSRVGPPNCK